MLQASIGKAAVDFALLRLLAVPQCGLASCKTADPGLIPFPGNVAEHVRMDVQSDVGHVVDVLARDEPDDFTDLAFGVMPGHAGKRFGVDLFLLGELRDIVESSALGVGEQRAIAVLLERIEFGLLHRSFDGERTTDIDAKETNVGPGHLFPNEHDGLRRQLQFFVQLADLCVELTESNRQPRGMHFQRRQHFAELLAREEIRQLHHQSPGLFDGGKKCVRVWGFHRYACHFCAFLSLLRPILDPTPTSPVFSFLS